MNKQELERFELFKEEVLKHDRISIDSLWILINRFALNKYGVSSKYKMHYHRYWIKMLVNSGVLEESNLVGQFNVIRDYQF